MKIKDIEIVNEGTVTKTVAIYPGRFHPFHKGHKAVYDELVKLYGTDNVYIATSGKVEPPKSPFSFEEKKSIIMLTGVPGDKIIETRSPYNPSEITNQLDADSTALVFGVGQKDMDDSPRFAFKPKKDGSPSYLQAFKGQPHSLDVHGYVQAVPTKTFTVLGQEAKSASEMRAQFAQIPDTATQKKFIVDLFGAYDKDVHKLMIEKLKQGKV
jgi:hypothetical protein